MAMLPKKPNVPDLPGWRNEGPKAGSGKIRVNPGRAASPSAYRSGRDPDGGKALTRAGAGTMCAGGKR